MNPNETFNYGTYEEGGEDVEDVEDFDDFIENNNTGIDYYAILNVPKSVNTKNTNIFNTNTNTIIFTAITTTNNNNSSNNNNNNIVIISKKCLLNKF